MNIQPPPIFNTFWMQYLETIDDPQAAGGLFYEACQFGHTAENANKTADLILTGAKTATSSLLAEFEITGKPLPETGSLSIVVDGWDKAVAVIETLEVKVIPFDEVDARFVHDYGEGDLSMNFWQTAMWAYFFEQCERLGTVAAEQMPMVCEYFQVVYTGGARTH